MTLRHSLLKGGYGSLSFGKGQGGISGAIFDSIVPMKKTTKPAPYLSIRPDHGIRGNPGARKSDLDSCLEFIPMKIAAGMTTFLAIFLFDFQNTKLKQSMGLTSEKRRKKGRETGDGEFRS